MALDLPRLLLETVQLVQAVGEGDFTEAKFRSRIVGDLAWSDGCSRVGNAAMNLEISLGAMPGDLLQRYEDDLAFLLAEVEVVLKPLRDRPSS